MSFVSSSSIMSWNNEELPFLNISKAEYGISSIEPMGQFKVVVSGAQIFNYVENGVYYAVPGYRATTRMGYNLPHMFVPDKLNEGYWRKGQEPIQFNNETEFTFNSVNVIGLEDLKKGAPEIVILGSNISPFNATGEAFFLTNHIQRATAK